MKRMFEKHAKNAQPLNEPASKRVPIPTSAPDSLITAPDYEGYQILRQMQSILPVKCGEFLDSTNPDEDNGSYFDQIIDAALMECLCRLKDENIEHERVIRGALKKLNQEKNHETEKELETLRHRLEEAEKRYELICKVYYAGTAYEKYKEVTS